MKKLTEKENMQHELVLEANTKASVNINDKVAHIQISGEIDKAYAKQIQEELAAYIRKHEMLEPFKVIDISIKL
jgi:anti-anti-sigma regulatory factor